MSVITLYLGPRSTEHRLYLDMVVVFTFHPDEKCSVSRMYQNKQNHNLRSMLSFTFGAFLTFSTVTSHLPTTTPPSVAQNPSLLNSTYYEEILLCTLPKSCILQLKLISYYSNFCERWSNVILFMRKTHYLKILNKSLFILHFPHLNKPSSPGFSPQHSTSNSLSRHN